MITPIVILAVSAIFFVIGKIRSDIVALCTLLSLILTNVLTPAEALSGFSNPVIIMMIGLFIVGGAILQTGLAKTISGKILKTVGTNDTVILIVVMLVTAVIGAFVSNTGTVALMLPIVVSIASRARVSAKKLLMPLAFASSMGGMLTLIGTPPNLIIQEALTEAGEKGLSFFSFLPVGIVCLTVGTITLIPLCKWFLSKKDTSSEDNGKKQKSLTQLVDEYKLTEQLQILYIPQDSKLAGMTMSKLDLNNVYGLTILERRQESSINNKFIKNINQNTVNADTVFNSKDVLFVSGDSSMVKRFVEDFNLSVMKTTDKRLDFYDIGIAELVMLPSARLLGRKIRNTAFREKYDTNIVAIRRRGEYITDNLADQELKSGDILLIQGTWTNIEKLGQYEEGWVILGQPLEAASRVALTHKSHIAALIMLCMVIAMATDFIPIAPVTAVLLASVAMILCGCFRSIEDAYKTINWESVVLIAAMMPVSIALEKTGASTLLSNTLVNSLGSAGPTVLLAGIYLTTSVLSLFLSNTATAVLMAPIAMQSAAGLNITPYAFLFAVTLGASMCFASPFSTPPNALVMQAGRYTFSDYLKVGLPLQLVIGIAMVIILPFIFPY